MRGYEAGSSKKQHGSDEVGFFKAFEDLFKPFTTAMNMCQVQNEGKDGTGCNPHMSVVRNVREQHSGHYEEDMMKPRTSSIGGLVQADARPYATQNVIVGLREPSARSTASASSAESFMDWRPSATPQVLVTSPVREENRRLSLTTEMADSLPCSPPALAARKAARASLADYAHAGEYWSAPENSSQDLSLSSDRPWHHQHHQQHQDLRYQQQIQQQEHHHQNQKNHQQAPGAQQSRSPAHSPNRGVEPNRRMTKLEAEARIFGSSATPRQQEHPSSSHGRQQQQDHVYHGRQQQDDLSVCRDGNSSPPVWRETLPPYMPIGSPRPIYKNFTIRAEIFETSEGSDSPLSVV